MKPPPSGLTASGPNAAARLPQLHADLDAVCARTFGHYPWDDWERHALASGLDAELAGLRPLLICEAFNHGWEAWLQYLCGWGDEDYPALSTDWSWGFLRADARRLLATLQAQPATPHL